MCAPKRSFGVLAELLAQLPDSPGVYQMLAADGSVLYIGKAISLRNRVRSYFQAGAAHPPRIAAMVERVADIRTILVANEVEALILEANLIKRHQPPYNVRLRDDKRYPYLKATNELYPRLVFTRTIKEDGAKYFGPYTNAQALRSLIDLVRRVFPLRTCRDPIDGKRKRPCLQYHIKRCFAPCVGYQDQCDYNRIVDEVVMFLEGRQDALLARLNEEMRVSSEQMQYETAARIRDRIVAVRRMMEKQHVVWTSRLDMDLLALARSHGQACAQVFLVRAGKLIGQEHFILDGVAEQDDARILDDFCTQFYIVASLPKEVLVQTLPHERETLEAWLSERKGKRVRILWAQRGARAEFLRTVQKNAEQNLRAFLAHQEVQESAQAQALAEVADALELPQPPRRIECYDISNIGGTHPVASMVVFLEGRAKKSEYRKFKIQYDRGSNDFAMMQETLRRRLRYLRPQQSEEQFPERELSKREKFSRRPDLLLIDGGKGQLQAVVEVLEELDLVGIPIAGLAKEHEWLYLPGESEPIILAPHSAGLHLVMRIRDEAHRFAITFHRQRRGKSMLKSAIDELEGVGPIRRKRLLDAFGSVGALRRASLDEIGAVKGMTPALAAAVKTKLESAKSASRGDREA